MRIHSVWVDAQSFEPNNKIELNKAESHHIKTVLRIKNNSEIRCFNGLGHIAKAQCFIENKSVFFNIHSVESFSRQNELHLLGPLPKAKRLGFMMEKLQELGVSSFTPIDTEYSLANNLDKKLTEKITQKLKDACKQSLCPWLLKLNPLLSFSDALKKAPLYALNADGEYADSLPSLDSNIHLMLGPEGGWSPSELQLLAENNIPKLKCSGHILRMETAAITGASRLLEKINPYKLA